MVQRWPIIEWSYHVVPPLETEQSNFVDKIERAKKVPLFGTYARKYAILANNM